MIMQFITPLLISFFSGIIILRFLVPFLTKKKMDQTEREELASHQVKNGTPTMGGIAIILAFVIGICLFIGREPGVLPVVVLTVGFGFIGFLDDYLKVIKKNPDGLIASGCVYNYFLLCNRKEKSYLFRASYSIYRRRDD